MTAPAQSNLSRRGFLATAACSCLAQLSGQSDFIIDLHQHLNYAGRSDEELIAHQRAMGVHKTVILPPRSPQSGGRGSPRRTTSRDLLLRLVGYVEENATRRIGTQKLILR